MGNLSFKLQKKILVIILNYTCYQYSVPNPRQTFFLIIYTYPIYPGTYKTVCLRPASTQLLKEDLKLCSLPLDKSMFIKYNGNCK